MDFYEFAEESKKTMKESDSREISLYHSASGIVTEIKELQDAFTPEHRVEELGDICWFLALLYKYIPFSFGAGYINPVTNKGILDYMLFKSIDLLDSVKGNVQYGRENLNEISAYAECVSNCIKDYSHHMRVSMDQVFDINIRKLQRKRFKSGYSDSAAINRDTASESEEFKL